MLEGYMVQDNLARVPYSIGVVDVDNASKHAFMMVDKGTAFPAKGNVVVKVTTKEKGKTKLSIGEINFDKHEYKVIGTLDVEYKKIKENYPLIVAAEYKNLYTISVEVKDAMSGASIKQSVISICRPKYVAPAPVKVPQTATPVQPTKTVQPTQPVNNAPKKPLFDAEAYREEQERIAKKKEQEALENARLIKEAKEKSMKVRYNKSMKELDSLIGLENVKESIRMLTKRIEYEKMRNKSLGNEDTPIDCPRFIFNGNPGTGKTTVARLLGDIYYGCGLLSTGELVEVSREDLVGEYIGQTAKKTKEACDKAHGGVLFIDEAYSIVQKAENDFGKEAIATLIKEMEDNRNDMIVILAGYTEEMNELLDANSGIKSRITDTISFEDYSMDELFKIADKVAQKKDYTITSDGKKAFEYLINEKKVDNKFGNAREVRNIIDKAISRKAMLYSKGVEESLVELTSADFGVELSKNVESSAKVILSNLDTLTGLASAKKDVRQIVNKAKYMIREVNDGNMSADELALNMNLCFVGNPGTGKTTVARIYAKLLHSIGLTKTDKVYEVSRSELVAPYQGQTAIKTKEVCQKAYGGVLFIDEAYSLVQGEGDSFGMEALNALIKEMEDNRDRLVVILAGYTKEMNEFMEHNSGLRSRISKFIEFDDYTADELMCIFEKYCTEKKCTIDDDAKVEVKCVINDMVDNKDNTFGNAREIRKLFENIFMSMISRVEDLELSGADRKRITLEDVQNR